VIVFVALEGVEGRPVPVPAWTPRDADEQRQAERALRVMGLSKDIEQAIAELGTASPAR
jgi:acyl-CoA hydrolase